jgi:hypothetical protein
MRLELALEQELDAGEQEEAPNRYMIQWKRISSAAPAKMNSARMSSAPKMPQNSTDADRRREP